MVSRDKVFAHLRPWKSQEWIFSSTGYERPGGRYEFFFRPCMLSLSLLLRNLNQVTIVGIYSD